MEEWKIVLLTGFVSVLSSIITAMISLTITHKNDVKKVLLENRTNLYFEVYSALEPFLHNPKRVFNQDYVNKVVEYKPKIKLLSSKKTFESYRCIYEVIMHKFIEFRDFYRENDPHTKPENIEIVCDSEGIEEEIYHGSNFEEVYFEKDIELFKKENAPSTEIISECLFNLCTNMRKDLGSDIK